MTRPVYWTGCLVILVLVIAGVSPGEFLALWLVRATLICLRVKDIGYPVAGNKRLNMRLLGLLVPFAWIYLGCLATGSRGPATKTALQPVAVWSETP